MKDTKPSPRFWDRIANKYARSPISNEAAYQRKLESTRQHLTPETRLLEIGCGTGTTAVNHAPYVARITAVDISANMLDIARQRAGDGGVENITFRQAAAEDFRADNESQDIVMAMSLLHLLPDRHALIASAWQWLRPGGIFISSTACIGDGWPLVRRVLPLATALRLAPYVAVFGRETLLEDIRRAGFEIENEWQPSRKEAVYIEARKPNS